MNHNFQRRKTSQDPNLKGQVFSLFQQICQLCLAIVERNEKPLDDRKVPEAFGADGPRKWPVLRNLEMLKRVVGSIYYSWSIKSPNKESPVVEKSKRNLKLTEPKKEKSLYAFDSQDSKLYFN